MDVILFHLSSQVKGRFGWERYLEWLFQETDDILHSRNAAKRQRYVVKGGKKSTCLQNPKALCLNPRFSIRIAV